MGALARLGLYGLVLVVVFAVAAVTAGAIVPESTVRSWTEESAATGHSAADDVGTAGSEGPAGGASSLGLGVVEGGYQLTGLTAPAGVGTDGELSLAIAGPDGQAVTNFDLEHDQELHLISVRADGQHFRRVHPVMGADGTWSIPWRWEAAGTYRVFADFVPTETGNGTTVSSSAQVGGSYVPSPAAPVATASVDGFEVGIAGELVAGESTELTVTVSRDGQPVTTLEPYLGAFGHLVVLRQGDLAYLHAHPHGEEPQAGETSGPKIVFEATAPTPGRYLLYLDFQVAGQVHTAPLVLDTTGRSGSRAGHDDGEYANTGDAPEHGDDHDDG
jgi:hypothetical protein